MLNFMQKVVSKGRWTLRWVGLFLDDFQALATSSVTSYFQPLKNSKLDDCVPRDDSHSGRAPTDTELEDFFGVGASEPPEEAIHCSEAYDEHCATAAFAKRTIEFRHTGEEMEFQAKRAKSQLFSSTPGVVTDKS